MDGALLIKEVIAMYDKKAEQLGVHKLERERNHAIVCGFFTFIVDADIEIMFKDKRFVPIRHDAPSQN